MSEWEDYYEILGVSPEASPEEVKQAYRYKVNILHPDRLTTAPERIRRQAEEDLKKVNRAFGILRDPAKRREYHAEWLKRKRGAKEPAYAESTPARDSDKKEKARSFSIEGLSDVEAKRLLKKFARFRSLIILPFGFLNDAQTVESKKVFCRREKWIRWRKQEQTQVRKNVPYSEYASYRRDYPNRGKDTSYYERMPPIREYIIPGTESEERCIECHGQGLIRCDICHGKGMVTCYRCEGAGQTLESEECPRCLGEGRTDKTVIRRRPMSSGRIYEEHFEIEDECPKCHGLGYREYFTRCYSCRGTGSEECAACNGSGETRCRVCEGKGKLYGAKVHTVQIKCDEADRGWSTGPVPEKYMKAARGWYKNEEELTPPSDHIVKMQRVRISVPVAYIRYTFAGKSYVLCEVGYGLKKARGVLKFDSYPRSLKKLAAFVGGIILIVVVITAVAVFVVG